MEILILIAARNNNGKRRTSKQVSVREAVLAGRYAREREAGAEGEIGWIWRRPPASERVGGRCHHTAKQAAIKNASSPPQQRQLPRSAFIAQRSDGSARWFESRPLQFQSI